MKANILKIMVAIAVFNAIALTACGAIFTNKTVVTGSGKVVTESRNVGGFTGVIINGAGKVTIDQTGTESLSISADDNLLQYIVTEVRGGKLVIEFKPNVLTSRTTDLTFALTVKNLNSIEANGAVAIEGKNLQSSQLSVSLNGAGATKLAGKVDQLTVSLDGMGAHNSENMECKRATVSNSGAGAAVVRVSEQLNATISGVGAIEYIGNPQVNKSISGLGAVRQR